MYWRILGGAPGTPPRGSNSFIFMQFLSKKLENNNTLDVGAPPRENPGSATGIDMILYLYTQLNYMDAK